jgi:hypothetical protein
MDASKVRLSTEELALAADARVMLVKGSVIRKVTGLFEALSVMQAEVLQSYADLIPEAAATTPKVSRGENYRGQPYVVLDYPRLFRPDDIFAIRTMFLWGHHLSITLHLRGPQRDRLLPRLEDCLPALQDGGFQVCISNEEWEHHFGEDYVKPAREMVQEEWRALLGERPFTKVACAYAPDVLVDAMGPLMKAYAGTLAILR